VKSPTVLLTESPIESPMESHTEQACAREPVLNVAAFTKNSRVVGPGLRDALWVQGCSIRCPGCVNTAYFEHEPRLLLPVSRLLAHFAARCGSIDGLSVLGGEPTEQAEAVAALVEGVRDLGFSTVVYSGRTYERLASSGEPSIRRLLAATDLLIEGPFVQALADPSLRWRGSRNQRLYHLTGRLVGTDPDEDRVAGEILVASDRVLLNGVGLAPLQVLLKREHAPCTGK